MARQPKKNTGKKGSKPDEEDPNGEQDDGEAVEIGPNGKVRKVKPGAPELAGDDGDPLNQEREPRTKPKLPDPVVTPPPPVAAPDAGVPAPPPDAGVARPAPPPLELTSNTGVGGSNLQKARQSVQVTTLTYADLVAAWDKRRLAKDPAAAQRELMAVLLIFRALGGGAPEGAQAFDLALALVDEAHAALERLELDRAVQLSDAAVILGPSVSATHMMVARARWAKAPGELGPPASAIWMAVKTEASDLRSVLRWLFGLGVALGLSIMALLMGMALLAGGRRLPLLFHDVGHLFPAFFRGPLTSAVALAVILLPVVVGAGPLVCALWWLTFCWLYLEQAERIVGVVAALLTAAVPFLMDVTAPVLLFPSSDANAQYLAQTDLGRTAAVAPQVERAAKDLVGKAVSGLVHKRLGNLELARERFEDALRLEPRIAWLHVNLGCVFASQGHIDRAQMEFERAAEIDPQDVLALHNAATLHNLMNRIGAARDAWDAAEKINHLQAQGYRDRSTGPLPKPHNIAFVDAPVPQDLLTAGALRSTPESEAVADDLWRRVCPWVPRPLYPALVLMLLLFWAALAAIALKFPAARTCRKCGGAACRSCDGKDVDRNHCAQCFNAFLVRGARVEAALKIRKDLQVRRYRIRQRLMLRGISVLVAGGGQLLAGMPVRGAVLLWVFSLGVSTVVLTTLALPDPLGVGHGIMVLRAGIALVPVVIAWLVSLIIAFRADE